MGITFYTAIIAIFREGRSNPNSKSKKVVGAKVPAAHGPAGGTAPLLRVWG